MIALYVQDNGVSEVIHVRVDKTIEVNGHIMYCWVITSNVSKLTSKSKGDKVVVEDDKVLEK